MGACHTRAGGCEPAAEAAPSSSSVTHLLPLGAARPQDATGPRVPFQATLALLPFFSFGACGHRRGTWTLWVLTPLGTATLLCPSVTSCRRPQPLLRSGPLRLLWGAQTPSRPAVRCHGRGGDGDGIHQPRDTLCRRRGDTSFEPCQPARGHQAQRQLTPSFPEGCRLSSAPLPKSPDACDCPGRDREIQPDGRGGSPQACGHPRLTSASSSSSSHWCSAARGSPRSFRSAITPCKTPVRDDMGSCCPATTPHRVPKAWGGDTLAVGP